MTTKTPAAKPHPAHTDADVEFAEVVEELDDILESIQKRLPETPHWEYCEGLMTALLCTRRVIGPDEWLPVLFECEADQIFTNADERARFLAAWNKREAQIVAALAQPYDEHSDEIAFVPAAPDLRGLMASLPADERAEAMKEMDEPPPALAQAWACGFLDAVDAWEDDWQPPRNKELAAHMDDALVCLEDLLDDDTDPPVFNLFDPDGPPSVSATRADAFAAALSAVVALYTIGQMQRAGARPVRHGGKPDRNGPCPCGSGKKYKKCCGA